VNEDNQVQEAIEKFAAAALHLMNCFGIGPFNHGALSKYATAQLPGLPGAVPVQPLGWPPASLASPGGGERIYVYIAGSNGCLRLSKLNNHKVYKIGTTCDPSIEKRLAETAGDKYGAAVRQGRGFVVEPGFDAWIALAIATSRTSADPGITVLPRSIAADLPAEDGTDNRNWDAHSSLERNHKAHTRAVNKPIAGLLADLAARGLLDQTLVVWTSEFGRTSYGQSGDGRDHNPWGYTQWLAGGGSKAGYSHSQTDEIGLRSVDKGTDTYDVHATVLQLLGLDHLKTTYLRAGRRERPTVIYGSVVKELLA
jgi:hypothetical protein